MQKINLEIEVDDSVVSCFENVTMKLDNQHFNVDQGLDQTAYTLRLVATPATPKPKTRRYWIEVLSLVEYPWERHTTHRQAVWGRFRDQHMRGVGYSLDETKKEVERRKTMYKKLKYRIVDIEDGDKVVYPDQQREYKVEFQVLGGTWVVHEECPLPTTASFSDVKKWVHCRMQLHPGIRYRILCTSTGQRTNIHKEYRVEYNIAPSSNMLWERIPHMLISISNTSSLEDLVAWTKDRQRTHSFASYRIVDVCTNKVVKLFLANTRQYVVEFNVNYGRECYWEKNFTDFNTQVPENASLIDVQTWVCSRAKRYPSVRYRIFDTRHNVYMTFKVKESSKHD